MKRDVALRIDGMMIGARAYLDGVAHYMKNNLDQEEFGKLVKIVGASMFETVELSSYLHQLFPDIVPKELK